MVRTADVDETLRPWEAPSAYLERVTRAKLEAVRVPPAARILVADTIVVVPGDVVLGKPRDDADAEAMLARLSGRTHEVRTRFVLADPEPSAPAYGETVTTRITFRTLRAAEIAGYVATGEGGDKAGSYAVQGRAAAFVSRIEGSYTAVVGLPLSEVAVAMQALGWV